MRPDNFDVQQLIDDLQGTCDSIEDYLPDGMKEDDLTDADHDEIDCAIFNCACCGWWYGTEEASESNDEVCEDCAE